MHFCRLWALYAQSMTKLTETIINFMFLNLNWKQNMSTKRWNTLTDSITAVGDQICRANKKTLIQKKSYIPNGIRSWFCWHGSSLIQIVITIIVESIHTVSFCLSFSSFSTSALYFHSVLKGKLSATFESLSIFGWIAVQLKPSIWIHYIVISVYFIPLKIGHIDRRKKMTLMNYESGNDRIKESKMTRSQISK